MTSESSSLCLGSIPVREAWSLLQVRETDGHSQPLLLYKYSRSAHHPLCLWAVAPNLDIRGQQRHGFRMARLLAKFFRLCQRVSCPHPLLLSEEIMKTRHDVKTALTEG